ncbi:hypothetical protein [Tissierella praeacuta]|uniref:hypothetical protein n=1 Tax=Tissierella praeacuta TaxID=43131 RepID=UPI003342C1C6
MRKYISLVIVITCATLLLIRCDQDTAVLGSGEHSKPIVVTDEVAWDRIPMVKVNGELYVFKLIILRFYSRTLGLFFISI